MMTPTKRIFSFLFLIMMVSLVKAEGLSIIDASGKIQNDVMTLDARFDVQLSDAIIEALHNGINIELITQIELLAPRAWRKDEQLMQWKKVQTLKYHSLTDRYLLETPGSNFPRSYLSLNDLLAELNSYFFQHTLSKDLLPLGWETARVKLKIAVNRAILPIPLRVLSYVLTQWRRSHDELDWLVPVIP